MEEVSELGLRGEFVVDEACLECLLGSHDEDGLGGTGADTAQEVVLSCFLSQNVLLNVSVGSEANVVLRDREHQQGAVSLVQARGAAGLDGVLDNVDSAHSVLLWVELHDSLGVLSRVGARNLDGTSDATDEG